MRGETGVSVPVEVQTSDKVGSKDPSNHQASFAQSDVQVASIASFAYSISVPDNDAPFNMYLEQILSR